MSTSSASPWHEKVCAEENRLMRRLSLDELLALAKTHNMSDAEIEAQKASWVRSCISQPGDPYAVALLPTGSQERKDTPIYSGVVKYFPLALAEIARLSKAGNDKHNPGEPLHWSRGKSNDHADCVMRHLLEVGTIDPDDGHRHATKLAWRALALLQLELEAAANAEKTSAYDVS